jgi:hypothetical protein
MKKKNNHHYYYALSLAVLIVVIAAVYYSSKSSRNNDEGIVHEVKASETLNYQNAEYGFAFDYDKDYTLSTSGEEPNFFQFEGKTLASVSMPQSEYPDTNLGSARATVAVQTESTKSVCEQKRDMNLESAAAGTRYKTRVFRVFGNGNCYEISFTVGIANIENYEPGAVREVDERDVWNKIMGVMNTFNFIE